MNIQNYNMSAKRWKAANHEFLHIIVPYLRSIKMSQDHFNSLSEEERKRIKIRAHIHKLKKSF